MAALFMSHLAFALAWQVSLGKCFHASILGQDSWLTYRLSLPSEPYPDPLPPAKTPIDELGTCAPLNHMVHAVTTNIISSQFVLTP